MVEVKRREKESHEAMMRRFSRRILQSQVVARARKQRFHERKLSKNLRRTKAVKRAELREEREELSRQGKIPYNTFGSNRRFGQGRRW